MTQKELDIFRAKLNIELQLIDDIIDHAKIPINYSGEIVIKFFISPKVYNRVKERFPLAKVICVETEKYKNFFGKGISKDNIIYVKDEKEPLENMFKDPKFISNPPYGNIGGPVVALDKMAFPKAKQSILMPISCYKAKVKWYDGKEYPLYQFVDTVKVVGSAGFGTAVLAENNCIITLLDEPDTTKTYEDLMFLTVDQRYLEYYKWNLEHAGKFNIISASYTTIEEHDIKTEFIETNRCGSIKSGAGFGKGGAGYKYNVEKTTNIDKWPSGLISIKCIDEAEKDILAKLWYSGKRKNECLLSKAIIGVNITTTSGTCDMALPQLDLRVLPIHQKSLWEAGKYDEALLAEMGFKLEGDTIVKA